MEPANCLLLARREAARSAAASNGARPAAGSFLSTRQRSGTARGGSARGRDFSVARRLAPLAMTAAPGQRFAVAPGRRPGGGDGIAAIAVADIAPVTFATAVRRPLPSPWPTPFAVATSPAVDAGCAAGQQREEASLLPLRRGEAWGGDCIAAIAVTNIAAVAFATAARGPLPSPRPTPFAVAVTDTARPTWLLFAVVAARLPLWLQLRLRRAGRGG